MSEHGKRPPALTSLQPRKALGQNFIFDPDILRRIALATGPVDGQTVVEVGPGPGGLTRALLEAGAAPLIAVEADPRFAMALKTWPEASTQRLHIIEGDARKMDWAALMTKADGTMPVRIIGNLPYNIATPLLINWLKAGFWRGDMALMFQKEVAARICARPGDKLYGRLSVISQAVTKPTIAFTLPPGAFMPPPKVESAVVVFQSLSQTDRCQDILALETVATAAFGQRRKMLRAALKNLASAHKQDPVEWLERSGIDPTARAETLDQAAFRRLASLPSLSAGRRSHFHHI